MKSSKAKTIKGSTDAMPVVAEVVPVGYSYTEPTSNDPAERIKHHLSHARVAANVAMRHIIEAGWELAKQKQFLGYGEWVAWCEHNIQISRQTADKYIDAFRKTVGAQRAQQAIGLEAKLLKKELDAATVGMEEKTVRQAMIEIGVIKPTPGHGGAREGAGRKLKDAAEVAAELKAVAENEAVIWASAKGSLDNLVQLDSKRDMFHRLSGDHLATVANLLADLSKKAADALAQRLSDGARPAFPQSC